MRTIFASYIGRLVCKLIRFFGWGVGDTWSGEVALRIDSSIIQKLAKRVKLVILVAGTNGKTTTVGMLRTMVGSHSFSNISGANLLNGIAAALITHVLPFQKKTEKIAIFEVDEATLPYAIIQLKPQIIILLNLFRDQLDRYGEVNTIAQKWKEALYKSPILSTVVLNADDPQVAYLGNDLKTQVLYFGIDSFDKQGKKQGELWGDSLFCPRCQTRLKFTEHAFSHLGNWHCLKCKLKRPKLTLDTGPIPVPIAGLHNKYNAAAALIGANLATSLAKETLIKRLNNFQPAFGRMEKLQLTKYNNVNIIIMLSKNPTGFNENIRLLSTFSDVGAILLVLNDRIPDGTDVSWIWDVDFEPIMKKSRQIIVSGDRTYDMGVRLKYQRSEMKDQKYKEKIKIFPKLKEAIIYALEKTRQGKNLYILPTYSAMLEVRKILLGRKIL